MKKQEYKNIPRALRLPFICVSLLPFIFGSLLAKNNFNLLRFILGFVAVAATHLSANLINDYADSKSGADWQDRRFYGFFGGSKLIQEGILPERFYRNLALSLASASAFSVIFLAVLLKSILIIVLFLLIILLAWSYSVKPLQLSYRKMGEFIIFLLFGPALVMGGYFIQTKVFPEARSFLLSLPFGFLTTAILYVNEIPDFPQDQTAKKFTWVGSSGLKTASLTYIILIFFAFVFIALCIARGFLGMISLISFLFVFLAIKSVKILRKHFSDKEKLIQSSKLTIILHTLVSIVLIIDLLI